MLDEEKAALELLLAKELFVPCAPPKGGNAICWLEGGIWTYELS